MGIPACLAGARSLIVRGVENVVVTLGAEGALVVSRYEYTLEPGYRVPVVDATGAGDACNAGWAVSLAESLALFEATRFANATGALATMALGAQEGMPDRRAVWDLLASDLA